MECGFPIVFRHQSHMARDLDLQRAWLHRASRCPSCASASSHRDDSQYDSHAGVPWSAVEREFFNVLMSVMFFQCSLFTPLWCFLVFILGPFFKLFSRWLVILHKGHSLPVSEFAHAEVRWHASQVSHSLETLSGSAWNPSRRTTASGILAASSKQEH